MTSGIGSTTATSRQSSLFLFVKLILICIFKLAIGIR